MRLDNFAQVDQFIQEWNSNDAKTSTVGHNYRSDWTNEEKTPLMRQTREEELLAEETI